MRYRWTCHLCEEPNAAGSTSCVKCGFPALASGLDIDRAISKTPAIDVEPSQAIARLPLSKKIAGGIALGVLIVGAFLGKFAYPIWLNITGLLLIALSAWALWALGFWGRDKAT